MTDIGEMRPSAACKSERPDAGAIRSVEFGSGRGWPIADIQLRAKVPIWSLS